MRARDWLFRTLTRPPYRDPEGRKGWLAPFAHARPHKLRRVGLTLAGWPEFSRPMKVAFLSDFHAGGHTGDVERLAAIVAEAAALAPDLVLYGGDYMNMIPFGGGRVPPDTVAEVLAQVQAPLGRIAVLGNHDRNYGEAAVAAALTAAGITVLSDACAAVTFEDHRIAIAGIHDARRDRPVARAMLAGLSPAQPTVVVAHDPWWFGHLPAGPHLMLAGHTHGGQICFPGIGPVRNASWAPLRWSYGLIEEEGRRMYVTSGLGCSALPLRVLMPPEFVLLAVSGAGT